jgi:hypothetical protein
VNNNMTTEQVYIDSSLFWSFLEIVPSIQGANILDTSCFLEMSQLDQSYYVICFMYCVAFSSPYVTLFTLQLTLQLTLSVTQPILLLCYV